MKKKRGRTLDQSSGIGVELVSCQDWEVSYHRDKEERRSRYRVHVLQSDTDIFKSQIFPPTFYKTLKDMFIN